MLYLPFMLDALPEGHTIQLPSFEAREHFVTIGNFRHEPNYDSVRYLKETIWPLVRDQLPQAEMHIYGSYPSQKVNQLNDEASGFLIKGWAEEVSDVMKNARVCLAPLRFGAGLKGKFVDAMQYGTPCVTTSIGAEGLEDGFGGFITDDPSELANKAIQLYKDSNQWHKKQALGFQLIQDKFNGTVLQDHFMQTVEAAKSQLPQRRAQNFIGAMLQQETLRSTKYLSKYIESKSQNC